MPDDDRKPRASQPSLNLLMDQHRHAGAVHIDAETLKKHFAQNRANHPSSANAAIKSDYLERVRREDPWPNKDLRTNSNASTSSIESCRIITPLDQLILNQEFEAGCVLTGDLNNIHRYSFELHASYERGSKPNLSTRINIFKGEAFSKNSLGEPAGVCAKSMLFSHTKLTDYSRPVYFFIVAKDLNNGGSNSEGVRSLDYPVVPSAVEVLDVWSMSSDKFSEINTFFKPSSTSEFKKLEQILQRHPNQKIAIYGHAFPLARPDAHPATAEEIKSLSTIYAKALYSILNHGFSHWENIIFTPEQYKLILSTLCKPDSTEKFFSGSINQDQQDVEYQNAIKSYKDIRKTGDSASSIIDKDTHTHLIESYIKTLWPNKVAPDSFVKFIGQKAPSGYYGCGGCNPLITNPGIHKDIANRISTRIVVAVFNEKKLIHNYPWPCIQCTSICSDKQPSHHYLHIVTQEKSKSAKSLLCNLLYHNNSLGPEVDLSSANYRLKLHIGDEIKIIFPQKDNATYTFESTTPQIEVAKESAYVFKFKSNSKLPLSNTAADRIVEIKYIIHGEQNAPGKNKGSFKIELFDTWLERSPETKWGFDDSSRTDLTKFDRDFSVWEYNIENTVPRMVTDNPDTYMLGSRCGEENKIELKSTLWRLDAEYFFIKSSKDLSIEANLYNDDSGACTLSIKSDKNSKIKITTKILSKYSGSVILSVDFFVKAAIANRVELIFLQDSNSPGSNFGDMLSGIDLNSIIDGVKKIHKTGFSELKIIADYDGSGTPIPKNTDIPFWNRSVDAYDPLLTACEKEAILVKSGVRTPKSLLSEFCRNRSEANGISQYCIFTKRIRSFVYLDSKLEEAPNSKIQFSIPKGQSEYFKHLRTAKHLTLGPRKGDGWLEFAIPSIKDQIRVDPNIFFLKHDHPIENINASAIPADWNRVIDYLRVRSGLINELMRINAEIAKGGKQDLVAKKVEAIKKINEHDALSGDWMVMVMNAGAWNGPMMFADRNADQETEKISTFGIDNMAKGNRINNETMIKFIAHELGHHLLGAQDVIDPRNIMNSYPIATVDPIFRAGINMEPYSLRYKCNWDFKSPQNMDDYSFSLWRGKIDKIIRANSNAAIIKAIQYKNVERQP